MCDDFKEYQTDISSTTGEGGPPSNPLTPDQQNVKVLLLGQLQQNEKLLDQNNALQNDIRRELITEFKETSTNIKDHIQKVDEGFKTVGQKFDDRIFNRRIAVISVFIAIASFIVSIVSIWIR